MDEISNLRKQIDKLDEQLLQIIAKRISVVRKIGNLKRKNKLPILNKKRRDDILKSALLKARISNVSEPFVKKLFNFIHEYSLEIQKEE